MHGTNQASEEVPTRCLAWKRQPGSNICNRCHCVCDCFDFCCILPLVAERYHDEIGRPAEHPERMMRRLFAQF